jgi:polyisoprenoid-binding protein YceI
MGLVKNVFSSFAMVSTIAFSAAILADNHGHKKTVAMDLTKSKVEWVGKKKVGSSHNGTVAIKSAELQIEKDAISGGSFVIDMNQIICEDLKDASTNAKLIGHLKSDDFFNVEKFPTASYEISKVDVLKNDKKGNTHLVHGDMTIRGKKSHVMFPAKVKIDGNKVSAEASLTFDRSKHDVKFGSTNFFADLVGDKIINNDIELKVSFQSQ